MTRDDDWTEILARLSALDILDLESRRDRSSMAKVADRDATAHHDEQGLIAPSRVLWTKDDAEMETMRIGVRVRERPREIRATAARLAAMAIERKTAPVILSYVDLSGFEQFGFRVERIKGRRLSEMRLQEMELESFWELELVIDLEDLSVVQ